MSKDLEERIEKKKRQLADFIRLSKALEMNASDRQQRIDLMLDDLSKLMAQRD